MKAGRALMPPSVGSRLAGAGQDILRWGEYDFAIVNDNLDTAFAELRAILMTERIRRTRALRWASWSTSC